MGIPEMVALSRKAQKEFENFTQEQVDKIVRAIGKVVFENAEPLAKMAAEETGMGLYEDKIKKNQGKARIITNSLNGVKSVGILPPSEQDEPGILKVAMPKGVIACVMPTTNPIVTPMFNSMIALKGRNSVIIAPHPRAKECTKKTVALFTAAVEKLGAPKNLIQMLAEPTQDLTAELMSACDAVVATGGMGMVKVAYSSGKPAYGVGAGNVQCIIDKGYDMSVAVPKIIEGRTFDNGIICSGEQTIIYNKADRDALIKALKDNNVYFTSDQAEVDKVRAVVFKGGHMNKDLVGQPAMKIADMCGLKVPAGTRCIVIEPPAYGAGDPLSKEKMCPLMTTYPCGSFEEAVKIANTNLDVEGRGHSASIHTDNKKNAEYAGSHIPVCRVVINQVCSTMAGGSFYNSLNPTTTLGCGSWGNNSISENLSYKHLINVIRIAYTLDNPKIPTDAEIFG